MLTHHLATGHWTVTDSLGRLIAGPFTSRRSAEIEQNAYDAIERKAKRKANRVNTVVDIDELCKLVGVDTLDTVMDRMDGSDTWGYVHKEALENGDTEEEAERKAMDAEYEEQAEYAMKYRDAVVAVAESLFSDHGLTLEGKVRKDGATYQWNVIPTVSWREAADKIRQTINGVGYFHFSSLKEFCDSIPASPKSVTMFHLHHMKRWYDVYGEPSAKYKLERALR